MAIRDDFFTALTNGAKWDVGVSINRTNPLPLDQYSVFKTETELNEYIAGAFSYPGQIIALVDENATTIYYLDQNKEKQPVGVIPEGDDKTIEVSAAGAISLLGAAGAENGTLPMIGEDGKLTWKTLEDIGAGDGNDNTTYQFTLGEDGKSFSIKTLFNGQPIKGEDDKELDPQVITFDIYTKTEVDAKIGAASVPDTSEGAGDGKAATGVYIAIEAEAARIDTIEETLEGAELTDTTYTVKEGEKVLSLDGTAFGTTLKIQKATHDNKTWVQLLGINDELVSEFDAAEFVADGFLTDAEYDADTHELVFTWNTSAGISEDRVPVGDLVDTYTAGNGLNLNDNQFSVKVLETDKYLTVDETGVHTKGIDDAIATAKDEAVAAAATDAQTKANAAKEAAIADADAKLANKANVNDVYTKSQVYNQDEIDELLENIQAGSSESAASVKTQLDSYKKVVNAEVWGNEEGTGDSRIDKLEAVGAQANVLEGVQLNGTDLVITDKKVNIDLSAYAKQADLNTTEANAQKGIADAKTAKEAADAADAKAVANTTLINGHETRLGAVETKANDNAAAILAHASEFSDLKGRVDGHDTAIANRYTKTEVYTKEEVNAITGTVTEGKTLVSMIAEKANSTDVYGKSEVYTKNEIAAITGTIPADSTIMAEIEKAKTAATYDDTQVKADIKTNADAIAAIYKAGEGEAPATGILANEIARATAAEAANAKSIADLTAAIDNVSNIMNFRGVVETVEEVENPQNGDVIIIGEQQWVYTEAGWKLVGDASGNAAAISALTKRVEANETAITALPGAIAQTLTDAKAYTDQQITAKLADYKIKSAVSGHEALKVDTKDGVVTIGFADEIILNGGNAN